MFSARRTPAATVPPLFVNGFESGAIGSPWTNAGLTVSSEAFAGAFGARETSTGAATWAWAPITPQNDVYYRVRFKVVSQGANNVYIMKLRTATGVAIGGLYRQSDGTLGFRNDVAAVTVCCAPAVAVGSWHTLELHATVGANGVTEVWLDGTKITALSVAQNLGTNPFGRLQLGDNMGARTYDVAFDDVVAATSYIGP
jgi:hypothetical protein